MCLHEGRGFSDIHLSHVHSSGQSTLAHIHRSSHHSAQHNSARTQQCNNTKAKQCNLKPQFLKIFFKISKSEQYQNLIKNMLTRRKERTPAWLLSVDITGVDSLPLQLMKATVLTESYNYLSIFIVICRLQRSLLTVAS